MKQKLFCAIVLFLLITSHPLTASDATYWPTFRGPSNTGVTVDADPPITWSESENIKWKVEVPGKGLSSPVIWEDKIFFLTSVPLNRTENKEDVEDDEEEEPTTEHKFDVVCMDRETGKIIWQKTVKQALPHEGHHGDASFASFSPVTDGKHVWANFGSQGLYCLDIEGDLKWSQELVEQRIRAGFGEGSSPVIAGKAVIVVADHEDQSYIYAFDKLTGKPLWKKERDEPTAWATPVTVEVEGKIQVIVNGCNYVRSYDINTGDEIWKCSGQTVNVVPTPVVGFGNVYCTSGFRGAALYAIKLGQTGDLSDSDAVVWKVDEATPYVPSPILIDEKIYVISGNREVISCYQAKDGKANYVKQKLEGVKGIYASPVGAKDRVYFAGRNGVTSVVKVSDTFEVLSTNTLDDRIDATPAIVGDEIYIKGIKYLYCI
ncbi:MAG: PQQ-binding-like beta-propeller repeat protein, partial [Planctomycetota bacterium]